MQPSGVAGTFGFVLKHAKKGKAKKGKQPGMSLRKRQKKRPAASRASTLL
jgi:hypothetical protein